MATAAARPKVIAEGLSRYQALTNISVPQRHPDSKLETGQNDLVLPGEIVELTERQAANLMDTSPKSGRMSPAVRPYSEHGDPLPRLTARHLSGALRRPMTPPPGDEGPRPDPPGSSHIRYMEDPPELAEPLPGSENNPVSPDAVDLPPGTRIGAI